MNRRYLIYRFQLNDHPSFNNEVDSIPTIQMSPFVDHRQGLLMNEAQISQVEFVAQTFLIGGFEESRTQHAMDFNRCADDLLCQIVIFEIAHLD